jgi:hypothetical protein
VRESSFCRGGQRFEATTLNPFVWVRMLEDGSDHVRSLSPVHARLKAGLDLLTSKYVSSGH